MPSLCRKCSKSEGWNPDESKWPKLLTGSDVCVQYVSCSFVQREEVRGGLIIGARFIEVAEV
jgi:hypothetical protein